MKVYRFKWLVIRGSNSTGFESFDFLATREFASKEAADAFSVSHANSLTAEFDAFVTRSVRVCRSQLAAEAASISPADPAAGGIIDRF